MPIKICALFCLLISAVFFTECQPAFAADRKIGDQKHEIIGVRIAKSSSMQLAELHDGAFSPALLRSIYIPAGTPILLLKREGIDPNGRDLLMAITASGILVYARTDGIHYFSEKIESYFDQSDIIAISNSNFTIKTKKYGDVSITPSEIYKATFSLNDKIRIRIGKDKIINKYRGDEYIDVEAARFVVIHRSQLDINSIKDPFGEYDPITEIRKVIESAQDWPWYKSKDKFVQAIASARFIKSKSCGDVIEIRKEAEAGAEFDTDARFLPIKIKLGISGSYKQTTTLPVGTDFQIERYSRGGEVVELKHERIYAEENCTKPIERQRLTIAQGSARSVQIDSSTKIEGLPQNASLFPEYSCREQYDQLLDFFARQQELPYDTAVFAISKFARYKKPQNAALCKN